LSQAFCLHVLNQQMENIALPGVIHFPDHNL